MSKVKFIDVSKWKKELHVHTSGTRNKYILTSDKGGDKYYFKKSLLKPNKDYKYEFWSEVIASQIGELLGFEVVHYDVAFFDKEIGCISKSVIDWNNEELTEGYAFIIEKYPDFQDNFKKAHSFQKIIGSLRTLELEHCIRNIIDMIVFDAIIGNTDRHSENWAVIISNKEVIDAIKEVGKKNNYKFSPLYDNGSSLGRELSNEKIENMLNNDSEFDRFINNGKPDIRWNAIHLNHFDLIKTIKLDYGDEVNFILDKIKRNYNKNIIKRLVDNIDRKTPQYFVDYKIPQNRKDFIVKYIDTRINILLNI
ncbi:MAG: hypothetical protein EZS26_002209 [Candidatus Ordinivivax streblomastigis]|uniref:HipA-like C-terminal domain-containing protein n=1 Tax=Candidatus Ordinivivax streblomastigis TaxID=2540710 RepID=A0A5M8NZK9_9BACT|nr:MAG: hypothetical protein EZS26_002209 [Candidatus Ordinivivax streblomastigis]